MNDQRLTNCTYEFWLDTWFATAQSDHAGMWPHNAAGYWCELPPEVELAYVTRTFQTSGSTLATFRDEHVAEALWELAGSSGVFHVLAQFPADSALVTNCLESIVTLFRDYFAAHCSPALGHLDEVGDSALDRVCYMWWDIFPFAIGMNGLTALDRALLDVMKQQLTIDHDAVRESALHGLGHIVSPRESAVQIIDAFLDSHPHIRPELRQYALDARAGGIT